MSSRLTKKATRMEIRSIALISACAAAAIAGGFGWYGHQTNNLVHEQTRRVAASLVNKILVMHHWVHLEQHSGDSAGSNWNPAHLAMALVDQDYQWRAILPANPKGLLPPKDELEEDLLASWQRPKKEESPATRPSSPYFQRIDANRDEYHYYQPIYAKSECVLCHRGLGKVPNPQLKSGDLMAIMHVNFSSAETVRAQNANRALCLVACILTLGATVLSISLVLRQSVFKPLMHNGGKDESPLRDAEV